MNKSLPHDEKIEKTVLGTMIATANRLSEVMPLMHSKLWYSQAHRVVWDVVNRRYTEGEVIDSMVVENEAEARGINIADVADVCGHMTAWGNLSHYIRDLQALALRRRVISMAASLQQKALDTEQGSVADLANSLVAGSDEVSEQAAAIVPHKHQWAKPIVTAADIMPQIMNPYPVPEESGLHPGWDNLNRIWRPAVAKVNVVFGIPGHGKSTFVHAHAVKMAEKYGIKWAFRSPESAPIYQWYRSLAEHHTGRRWSSLHENEREKAIAWVGEHFYAIDLPYETGSLPKILRYATELREHKGVRGLVIDPWNKVKGTKRADEDLTGYIIRSINTVKGWAEQHQGYPYIVAHPRTMETREGQEYPVPRVYQIYGGGAWVDAADNILCVYLHQATGEVTVYTEKIKVKPDQGICGNAKFSFFEDGKRYLPIESQVKQMEAF